MEPTRSRARYVPVPDRSRPKRAAWSHLTPRSRLHVELKVSKTPILNQRVAPDSSAPVGLKDVKDMLVNTNDVSTRARGSIWKFLLAFGVGLSVRLLLSKIEPLCGNAQGVDPLVVVFDVSELLKARKFARVGVRTVLFFAVASLMLSQFGVLFGGAVARSFSTDLKCVDGSCLAMSTNGTMLCSATAATDPSALLWVNDTIDLFMTAGTTYQQFSVSEQISATLSNLVPENSVGSFGGTSSVSVTTLRIWFSIAGARSVEPGAKNDNYVFIMLAHLNVLAGLLNRSVAPSRSGRVARHRGAHRVEHVAEIAESVGYLSLSLASGLATNVMGPWASRCMCAYSIAALSLTLWCMDASREVSHAHSRVVLSSLGATSNLNGTTVYMLMVCNFMAKIDGYDDMLAPGP
ncbi:hypothetical protein PybrP1_007807 [[Pythium] brassicae (nom. inval.)]|nr:hypothetical protein PybrP1_007807 [[Pythium] brassicae (nom. inval.)]